MRATFIRLSALALLPISLLAIIKPLRMASPVLVSNVHCYLETICTDDKTRLPEAQALYESAFIKAQQKVGEIHARPKITFCSTNSCREAMGIGTSAGLTMGTFGIAIAPRGWTVYYVTHELIHYQQAEKIGNVAMQFKPSWLIEGMAYSLSEDPRRPLTQPFESWRAKFEQWNHSRGFATLWHAANEAQ